MKFTLIELKFNMQAFFNTHLHFNWSVCIWFGTDIGHDKFFFFRYFVVISIYHHVYIVPQTDNDSIVAFKLFFYSVKLEIIWYIICQCTRGFQISNYLQKYWILIFVK